MIYRLRRKFIMVSAIAVAAVIAVVLAGTWCVNEYQTNKVLDTFAELIYLNKGAFPQFESMQPPPEGQDAGAPEGQDAKTDEGRGAAPIEGRDAKVPDGRDTTLPEGREAPPRVDAAVPRDLDGDMQRRNDFIRGYGFLSPETQFSMRFFVVNDDSEGELHAQTESVATVSTTQAIAYAEEVLRGSSTAGWVDDYRFGVFREDQRTSVVFVEGSMQRASMRQSMVSLSVILVGSGVVIMLLIVLFSKRIVRPVAESYDKQKRFITDANHELKTPLTLILSDLDILESENGPSEWIDDMRAEGANMAVLVNQMVELSRMDEGEGAFERVRSDLSALVRVECMRFEPAALERGFAYRVDVEDGIFAEIDMSAMRRLISILLDNALKYCDEGGSIRVELGRSRGEARLAVSNTFAAVQDTQLDALFERFYRADKARTAGSGAGIGLSIAAAIVEGHRGSIRALASDSRTISFEICIPCGR